jgi:hypothetical protein
MLQDGWMDGCVGIRRDNTTVTIPMLRKSRIEEMLTPVVLRDMFPIFSHCRQLTDFCRQLTFFVLHVSLISDNEQGILTHEPCLRRLHNEPLSMTKRQAGHR